MNSALPRIVQPVSSEARFSLMRGVRPTAAATPLEKCKGPTSCLQSRVDDCHPKDGSSTPQGSAPLLRRTRTAPVCTWLKGSSCAIFWAHFGGVRVLLSCHHGSDPMRRTQLRSTLSLTPRVACLSGLARPRCLGACHDLARCLRRWGC